MVDSRTPVLVGVGTAFDDVEAVELMVHAAELAAKDAGTPEILAAVERVAVPRGTWSYTDPARIVAERIGATGASTQLVDLGIPQQTLINQALSAIMAGDIDVALVVGAEAKARAARLAQRSHAANAEGIRTVILREGETDEIDQRGATPDVHQMPDGEFLARPEIENGLFAPVEQYALMESALRAADGISIDAHRREIADLWARFNAVARTNPEAAFPTPMTADQLYALGPDNRPLAFPYGKRHASQWTVDQSAALLLCSVKAATRFGIADDRWIFPLVGIDSSASVSLTKRRHLARWPAMRVLADAATERIGHPLTECDHIEVYSCFPLAVRVQQRELGLPPDGTPTITGGMAFAGGPFNSFVLQATAAMARRLLEHRGRGLVTTVSGMLTKPGLAVWSTEPDDRPPLLGDLADETRRATDTADVISGRDGHGTIAAYTVTYGGLEPKELVAIVDTPDGTRAIVKRADRALIERGLSEELVGTTV